MLPTIKSRCLLLYIPRHNTSYELRMRNLNTFSYYMFRHRLRVFENRVLRKIFGPKRDEEIREWRKLHNKELNYPHSSPNTVRVIKPRRMRWAGHVALYGRGEAYTGFWWGNLRERDHLGDRGVDGRIILRCIFRKWDVGVWTGSSWLRTGTGGGHL